ncbi:MAG: hypothetical protein WAU02_02365 [Candidatus Saccharimonadales bacterium]
MQKYNGISFADFNQNTSVLRDANGSRTTEYEMPSGNTTPRDFAELFSENYSSSLKDFVMTHDVIIIKSCYPNSNIKSAEELQTIKNYYRSIAAFFARRPDKQLIIMTSPPLIPLLTTNQNAVRAHELATWLSLEDFGTNTRVFNFFDLLAADSNRHANMLRRDYRRLLPFDAHPNKLASQTIAPKLVKFIL